MTARRAGSQGVRVAFFGAMSPLAREVMRHLEESALPVERIRLFDVPDKEGSVTEYAGEATLVSAPDPDLAGGADISFVCGHEDPRSAEYLDWIEAGEGRGVDMVGASRGRPGVSVVNCEVNPQEMDSGARLFATPHPIAHPLSTILHRLDREFGVQDACVTAFRPASDLGQEGIDELHQQTVSLLSFTKVPREVFGTQVAFNLTPIAFQDRDEGLLDKHVREDVLRVLGSELRLSLRVLQAPVFYGHCYCIHVELAREPGQTALEEALEGPGGIRVSREEDGRTPAELAAESGIWVADIAPDAGRRGAFWLWAIADAVRDGAALNAARMAGKLIETLV